VAEVCDSGGNLHGRRLPPLNYTNQTVVSISGFDAEIEKERKRVIDMPGKFGGKGKGYEDMPNAHTIGPSGDPLWKETIKHVIQTRSDHPVRCITDLVDHMIIECETVFAQTSHASDFMMYHDALSLWMDKDTQAYIKRVHPDMVDRFVKPVGTTCAGTRYSGSPPGNSPEHARGLDAYGFSDLKYAMSFNASLAAMYKIGDPRRIFNQGTPAGLWHLMEETWTTVRAPSDARIAEDIAGWEKVCEKIIEAKGCIVPDENFVQDIARERFMERGCERLSCISAIARTH
jgi:hypothetical protein